MSRILHLGVSLALVFAAGLAARAEAQAEAWGYVYVFNRLEVVALTGDDHRIGRLPENHITLTSPKVSRRHAAIRRGAEGAALVDLGSTNGSRLNGEPLRPREAKPLRSGDRIQLADELLLFHETLSGLWQQELELRMLASVVKLKLDLPQDYTQKSLGRETVIPVSTDATLNPGEERVDVTYHHPIDPAASFPKDSDAFVGNLVLEDGILELSLWAVDGAGSMTSRRSAISRLKHTTLRVSLASGEEASPPGDAGPWFPYRYLANLLELYPEDREQSLRYSRGLAIQDRPVALRDAAATLFFRHAIIPDETELLLLAVESRGGFVEKTCIERKIQLTAEERSALAEALEEGQLWLERARGRGARGKSVADAEAALSRAKTRLASLSGG